MNIHENNHRRILQDIARRAMTERGLLPDFSAGALAEIEKINAPANVSNELIRDQKELLWASIDNDDSRDLDQLTVAEKMPEGRVKVLVAIADVDSLVVKGSALDEHARVNTTSVSSSARAIVSGFSIM